MLGTQGDLFELSVLGLSIQRLHTCDVPSINTSLLSPQAASGCWVGREVFPPVGSVPFPPQWGQDRASSLILAISHPLAHPLRISRGKARHAGFGCCVWALPLCHGTCEGQGLEGSQAGCFRMPLLPGNSRVSFHPVEHGGHQPHQHHDLGPITAHVHTAVHLIGKMAEPEGRPPHSFPGPML